MSGPPNVSPAEVARFDAMAATWWDPDGPMRPLHRMNPLRVGWIAERIVRRNGAGARVLDVGCGAGIAAEALARRGFDVLGLDASAEAVAAARAHASTGAPGGAAPAYRAGSAEELVAEGARFPVVTALEVIEHVPDPAAFVATLARLLEPGGTLFVSTLNRTPRSYLAAKVAAELVLRWLPVGTHDWRMFVTPAELRGHAGAAGLRLSELAGLLRAPLSGRWSTGRDLSVNYIAMAEAPGRPATAGSGIAGPGIAGSGFAGSGFAGSAFTGSADAAASASAAGKPPHSSTRPA